MNPVAAAQRLRELLELGALALTYPAEGRTDARWRALSELAAVEDLSVARLAEAHCDADAIVVEADRRLPEGSLAGVWASRYGRGGVTAQRSEHGWILTGTLAFCSGAGLLDVALVDARRPDGAMQLFLVPLRCGGVEADTSSWCTPALAGTATGKVNLDVKVDADAAIGPPGFYLDRPGFWHGAIGVAACWAGGADGLVRGVAGHTDRDNPHALAALGEVAAARFAMRAVLTLAAADVDATPSVVDAAYALTVRHLVAAGCRDVLEAGQRATGPGPLAFDAEHARRAADLRLYIEQHHHGADLAVIGGVTAR